MPRLFAWMGAVLAVVSLAGGAAADQPDNTVHMKGIAQREAAAGDKGAQAYLDTIAGTNDAKRQVEGAAWLVAASERGVPEAQTQLAVMAQIQAAKHPDRADGLHRKAAEL